MREEKRTASPAASAVCVASHLIDPCVSPCGRTKQLRKMGTPCASFQSPCGQSGQLRKLSMPCASLPFPRGPSLQHRKLDTPCASILSPRGPSRHFRKLNTPCTSIRTPCGPSRQLRKQITPCASLHVGLVFDVSSMGKRNPHCASIRTSLIHVYHQVGRTWSSNGCTQSERRRRREMASTPGLRWCTRNGTSGPCQSALFAPRAFTTAAIKMSHIHTSFPPPYTVQQSDEMLHVQWFGKPSAHAPGTFGSSAACFRCKSNQHCQEVQLPKTCREPCNGRRRPRGSAKRSICFWTGVFLASRELQNALESWDLAGDCCNRKPCFAASRSTCDSPCRLTGKSTCNTGGCAFCFVLAANANPIQFQTKFGCRSEFLFSWHLQSIKNSTTSQESPSCSSGRFSQGKLR